MKIPPIKLNHLKTLTDDTGVLQHAKYSTPRRSEGYTTDDNARALIVCIRHLSLNCNHDTEKLIDVYLSFLLHMQRLDGRLHNLLSYARRFQDNVGSEDCMGRTLWACGCTMNSNLSEEKKRLPKEIFDQGFKWVSKFKSPRSIACAILGLQHYQKAFPRDKNLSLNTRTLADQLCEIYKRTSSSDWKWFEQYLTYANARLPQALFEAYSTTKNATYLKIGEDTLNFLIEEQIIEDKLVPIGNKRKYMKHGHKALYDQQPLEAECMVQAATAAFRVTRKEKYHKTANIAFHWFLGRNSQNIEVYNSKTGGCYDGITPQGVNLNQGAESTICYLLARLELEKSKLSETL
ncbi:MAG: glycosyltransferase [Candidatus Bathyarchaeota archaeon]|nr:MAG: glycosyltransferase [Candidatus Bathyarchaeota archaeon]